MSAPAPILPARQLEEFARRCQAVLACNPRDAKALAGICLVALASGQAQAAVAVARAAVAAGPQFGAAWVLLGQALKATHCAGAAAEAYQRALALDAANPLAHMGLGELHISTNQPEEALAAYDLALGGNPASAAAHLGRGHALALLGRDKEALAGYERALQFSPRWAEAEFACGFIHARRGDRAAAVARYRRAIGLRSDFAAAWMNLGCLLREEGLDLLALAALERAVQLQPGMTAGWLNLALAERDRNNDERAAAHLQRALALEPENLHALLAWSQFRLAQNDLHGAWAALHKALAGDPDHHEVVNMHGILLHTEGRYEEAIAVFLRAEALGCLTAAGNRGNSLMELGRPAEALAAHRRAAALDPQNAGSAYNLALTELRLGDWRQGWPRYEARLRFRDAVRSPMRLQQPRWNGEPLHGRRILLHAEQGLGDVVQFCRYAPLVAARGGALILQVHEPAAELIQSLTVVRSGNAMVTPLGSAPPEFELECPLMSLPAVFRTTVETVPWSGPYLSADPAAAAAKAALFCAPGLRVGVAWAGNPRYRADARRSMQLTTLLPLLRASGANWISLQKGAAAAQLAELPGDVRMHDGCSGDAGLAEAAALIATLDLVITTDTSIAHVAGALGRPVWILLPHLADWRWMHNTGTTPWYPTARLFRQTAPGDWQGVFARVSSALRSVRQTTLAAPAA